MDNSASTEFKQLIARGKEQGYLTIEEINDLLIWASESVKPHQILMSS